MTAASPDQTPLFRRGFWAVFAWTPALVVFAPLTLLAVGAFSKSWDSRGLHGYTTDAFMMAWTLVGNSAKFSLWLSAACALVATAVAVPAAYYITQTPGWRARTLLGAFSLPVVVPAILTAMGLLLAFPLLHGSWALMMGAYTAQALPLALWPIVTALQLVNLRQQNSAAKTLGASFMQRMRWIVFPTLLRPAIAGATSAYMICLAESSAGFFLASAEYQPFGVALYNAFQEVDLRVAAAATMILVGMLLPPILLHEVWLASLHRNLRGKNAGHLKAIT